MYDTYLIDLMDTYSDDVVDFYFDLAMEHCTKLGKIQPDTLFWERSRLGFLKLCDYIVYKALPLR